MNNPFVVEQAGALAERIAADAGDSAEARIRRAYALLYGREPEADELETGAGFASGGGWSRYAQMLLAASEFWSVR